MGRDPKEVGPSPAVRSCTVSVFSNIQHIFLPAPAEPEVLHDWRERILATFEVAQELQADIYGFGTSVYREYPRQWKEMKGNWDELFQQIELIVEVDLRLVNTGQIVQSLTMEENSQ